MSRSAKDHDYRRRANTKRREQMTAYWQRIRGGSHKRAKPRRPVTAVRPNSRSGCAPLPDALTAWWELSWLEGRFGKRAKSRPFRVAMKSAEREYLAWCKRERDARSKGGRPRKPRRLDVRSAA